MNQTFINYQQPKLQQIKHQKKLYGRTIEKFADFMIITKYGITTRWRVEN